MVRIDHIGRHPGAVAADAAGDVAPAIATVERAAQAAVLDAAIHNVRIAVIDRRLHPVGAEHVVPLPAVVAIGAVILGTADQQPCVAGITAKAVELHGGHTCADIGPGGAAVVSVENSPVRAGKKAVAMEIQGVDIGVHVRIRRIGVDPIGVYVPVEAAVGGTPDVHPAGEDLIGIGW